MTGNILHGLSTPGTAPEWSFLTKHAQVLLCVARDPEARLRDIALVVELTERRVHSILHDLIESGYVAKDKSGRRNRYEIRQDLPVPNLTDRAHVIGEIVNLLIFGKPVVPSVDLV